jgi:transcription-repair coupling factor (superfamily II helicase)
MYSDMTPSLRSWPASGQRTRLARPAGSADSALIAALPHPGQPVLILTASAQDAQRLQAELPFFRPELRIALLPDWETLPYDHFSPHSDLVSERLATLWQIRNGECDVVIAPVSTVITRLSPVSFLLSRTFWLKQKQRLDGRPRRVFGARRPDRPVPDGQRTALPHRPVR